MIRLAFDRTVVGVSMTSATQVSNEAVPQYAQVAVPVHLNKTFTYRLPAAMQRAARVGSRVMIQFGAKPTTGYIVALSARLREGTSLVESEIKDVQELLDVEPPLTPEVLEITRWVADYYAAPWGEVMRAALPAGINATVEQTVSITELGRQQIAIANESVPPAVSGGSDVASLALDLLANEGEFELNAFCLRMGSKSTPKWLRELEHENLVARSYRTRKTPTQSKKRRAVRLIEGSNEASSARTTKAQERAIETLRANQNAMSVSKLTKHAGVSDSVV